MELGADPQAQTVLDAVSKVENRLYGLQKAMLDATPDCIKIVSVDGNLVTMNRAGCLALNVAEDSNFGMSWLQLLPEEVRPLGADALCEAGKGKSARFPGKSVSDNGIIYWDNLLTPIIDASGQVVSILCVSRDVTAKTLLEKQLEDAISREKLLSREMSHRIKNLFSVVFGLIYLAEKEAGLANTPQLGTKILSEKLAALSRASDAVFAQGNNEGGEEGTLNLDTAIGSILQPYGDRCKLKGEALQIRQELLSTLALFFHELATNSVKYGALGRADGNVQVHWTVSGDMLDLTWVETGVPDISYPTRIGFGGEMQDRIVRSAGGTLKRTWGTDGLKVDLHLPATVLRRSPRPQG